MRRVRINGTPPQDWVAAADTVTAQLQAAAGVSLLPGEYTLQLLPALQKVADLPAAGTSLVAIGAFNGKIRVKAFDAAGAELANVEERKKEPTHSPFHELRQLLDGKWNPDTLSAFEKRELFKLATAIIRQSKLDAIIEANRSLWTDHRIRDWLLAQFNNKCWYAEAQDTVSSIHVDHYRPKGQIADDITGATSDGYWWQAFKWKNYKICGQLLNVKKKDVFPFADAVRADPSDPNTLDLESPILIDPCTDDARLVSYELEDEESCTAVPAGGIAPDEVDRATRTIDILGLNRLPRLNSKRAQFWKDCTMEIANYQGAKGAPCLKKIAQAAARAKIKKMISYEAELSSIVEACLRKTAPESLIASVLGRD